MKSSSSFAYPAEYYYPEFLESRPDDPQNPSTRPAAVATFIDDGKALTTTTRGLPNKPASIPKKLTTQQKPPANIALDIVTDQGLPDADIAKAFKADPKKNLVRDPAEKNIPRLIVDDTILRHAARTARFDTTNLDDKSIETSSYHHGIAQRTPLANGHANGDLMHRTKSVDTPRQPPIVQNITLLENEGQPVDDYWKQEVRVNDDGLVTIEPLEYDRNIYDGPFGLSRRATAIYYITFGLTTVLAAIFLIMTGVFYSQSYPSQSSNTGTLAGMGVCALAFYLSLQLFLIGLWHQKYRRENPRRIVRRTSRFEDPSAHMKTAMENGAAPSYSYRQPTDYSGYADYPGGAYTDYSSGGYVSNANDQMLLQQQGVTTGAGYYDAAVWPSNAVLTAQPDPKFFQPMEYAYAQQQQPALDSTPPVAVLTLPTTAASKTTDTTKSEKKRHRRRHHHRSKKTELDEPSKSTLESAAPTSSSVIEPPLPVLTKAPDTNELLRSIAESEKENRAKHSDRDVETSSLNGDRRHRHSRHRHHSRDRHHSRHRRRSCSSCSTCSSCSYNDYHSDFGGNSRYSRQHHFRGHQPIGLTERVLTPRQYREHPASPPSPPRSYSHLYQETGTGRSSQKKKTKDSSIGADLEDVPNVRDDRLDQIPVVRRTIIVEPYPAEPTSEIMLKSEENSSANTRLEKSSNLTDGHPRNVYTTTTIGTPKKPKKRSQSKEEIEEVILDDPEKKNARGNKKKKSKKRTVKKNAFHN